MRRFARAALLLTLAMTGCTVQPNPPRRRGAGALGLGAEARLALERYRIVDLSHTIDARAVRWPGDTLSFALHAGPADTASGPSAGWVRLPLDAGTRVRLQATGGRSGRSAADLPVEQLVGSAVVIDVSAQAARNPDYALTAEDVTTFEREHGEIRKGDIVLLRTGWARHWPDRRAYLGGDSASDFHWPGLSEGAARLLIGDRAIGALGTDAAAIDPGAAAGAPVLRYAAGADVPVLENLTNLATLPPFGAVVIALPAKIAGAAAAPVRAVALVADVGT